MNLSDSERLASFLEGEGFKLAEKRFAADLLILNTCGVRQAAEDRIYGLISTIKKENKAIKILVTGCLSKRKDVMKRMIGKVDWFLPIGDMRLIPSLLTGADDKLKFSLDPYRLKNGEKYLKLKPKYESSYSAVVPIGNGCNNFCSYCVVPYARGREVYRPTKDIILEVKDLIKKGYKEIILVAQNVNSYRDEKYNFAQLLAELVKISGKFWLRFFSSHPKDMSDELIKVVGSSDKICHHLHLPLQSGDNKILKAMNRKYSSTHYKKLIKKIRIAKPGVVITTDIIVGFPGETKSQFLNTLKVFQEIGFDMAYLAQYSPRPGTVSAEKMKDDVIKAEKKRRFEVLNAELKKIADKESKIYLNQEIEVLIDGLNKRGQYFGKSSSFKTVLIDAEKKKLPIGDFVKVKITRTRPFGLEGEIIKQNKPKVLVILGPTASGKTKLGVDLARKFKGEIISADSRQVFQGMDIGTGKDLAEYGRGRDKVKYHLISIANPKKDFDLAKYQKLAFKAIEDILGLKKLPIIVGGSGLYLQAIINNYELSSSSTNRKKRDELEKLGASELFRRLEKLKPSFAKKINNSDKNNARRLARYLEIVENGGTIDRRLDSPYEFLILGLDFPNEVLRERVSYRLLKRFEEGMIAEVKNLKEAGLSNERLESFGLEYRYINRHLNGVLSYNDMLKELEIASYRFAKRQKTWFKRFEKQGGRIYWLNKKIDLDGLVEGFLVTDV